MNMIDMKRLLAAVVATAACVAAADIHLVGDGLWRAPAAARRLLSAGTGVSGQQQPGGDWADWAMKAAEALKDQLGVTVAAEELAVRSEWTDMTGNVHVRLDQRYQGLPVRSRQLIVHFTPDGTVYQVNGHFIPGIAIDPTPRTAQPQDGELVVWLPSDADDGTSARLAWKTVQGRFWIYTDAHTGDRIATERRVRNDGARYADESSGEDWLLDYATTYGPKARTKAFPSGTPCTIRGQLPRPLWTNDAPCVVEVPGIRGNDGYFYLCGTNRYGRSFAVWNTDGVTNIYRKVKGREAPQPTAADVNGFARYGSDDWGDFHPEAMAAAADLVTVTEYFEAVYGRPSYLGRKGASSRTCAFVCCASKDSNGRITGGYDNAFFYSDVTKAGKEPIYSGCMYFGYSASQTYNILDVTAHEFSHGIAAESVGFPYEGETGALDESFADIFGVGCENLFQPEGPEYPDWTPQTADWFLGEDSGSARPIRDIAHPDSGFSAFVQPSVYRDSNWYEINPYGDDNGGVHMNSGVQNRFFYLLQERIGLAPALQLAYLTVTAYCTPNTGYTAVMRLWEDAARQLAGKTVNGVGIPSDAVDAVVECKNQVMATPAYTANKKRSFVGSFAEVEMDLKITVGKASDGKASIELVISDWYGWRQVEYGTLTVSTGKATVKSSMLGTFKLSFAADNIYVDWSLAKWLLEDPSSQLLLKCLAVHRPPSFIPTVADKLPTQASAGVKVSANLYEYLLWNWGDSISFSVKGLPAGLKFSTSTGKLSGVPSKAQSGTARFTMKSSVTGLSSVYSWKYSIKALPRWAKGNFGAYLLNAASNSVGSVRFKVTAAGKITGSVKIGKTTWKVSSKSYARGSMDDGSFGVTVKSKSGKKTASTSLTVKEDGITGSVTVGGTRYTFAGGPAIGLDLAADPISGSEVYLVPAGKSVRIGVVVASDSPYTVTARNLPAGLKLVGSASAGYAISGKATKPGELAKKAVFTVKNYAVTGGKSFQFRILVDNYRTDDIPIEDHYDDMIAGVPSDFIIPGATNCAAAGMPTGLSFVKSTGQVRGTPTAPGKYLVTFTRTYGTGKKAVKHTATTLFVVYQGSGYDDANPGVIADGIVVRAQATALNGPSPVSGEIQAGDAIVIHAGVRQQIDLATEGGLDGFANTLNCTKLPAGLSISSGKITGVATSPGEKRTVRVSATNKWKWTGSLVFTIEVVSLPNWVRGTFYGPALEPYLVPGGDPTGLANLTVGTAGKVSGKYTWDDGVVHAFSINCFAEEASGRFNAVKGVAKEGKARWSTDVSIRSEEYPSTDGDTLSRGVAEFSTKLTSTPNAADKVWIGTNGFFTATLRQDVWGMKRARLPAFAFTKKTTSFTRKVVGVKGYDLKLAFAAKGKVTVTAMRSGQTKAKASGSAHLTLLGYVPGTGWTGEVAVVLPKIGFCERFTVSIADVPSVRAGDIAVARAAAP